MLYLAATLNLLPTIALAVALLVALLSLSGCRYNVGRTTVSDVFAGLRVVSVGEPVGAVSLLESAAAEALAAQRAGLVLGRWDDVAWRRSWRRAFAADVARAADVLGGVA